jgi:hypothetical protein
MACTALVVNRRIVRGDLRGAACPWPPARGEWPSLGGPGWAMAADDRRPGGAEPAKGRPAPREGRDDRPALDRPRTAGAGLRGRLLGWYARKRGLELDPVAAIDKDPALQDALRRYARINPRGVEVILNDVLGRNE